MHRERRGPTCLSIAMVGLERSTAAGAPQGEVDEARAGDLRRQAEGGMAVPDSLGFLLIVPQQGHALRRSPTATNSVAYQRQAGTSQRGPKRYGRPSARSPAPGSPKAPAGPAAP